MEKFTITFKDEGSETYYEALFIEERRAYELMVEAVKLHERLSTERGFGVAKQMNAATLYARNNNEAAFLIYKMAELHGYSKAARPNDLKSAVISLFKAAHELGVEIPDTLKLGLG